MTLAGELFKWAFRKYGRRVRKFAKMVTQDILDSEERRRILCRFKNAEMDDVPGALIEAWRDVREGKYVRYFRQNRARRKFERAFKKGAYRFLKLVAIGMVLYVLFMTGPPMTFGVSVFAFLFIIWFLEDIFLMIYTLRRTRKFYLKGLDPPEMEKKRHRARLNLSYIIGTMFFVFSLMSVVFLIPPLSTPWDIKESYGGGSWPVIYVFIILLWFMAAKAIVVSFKYGHALSKRLAHLGHDKRIIRSMKRNETLSKYGVALTKYIYIPIILSGSFIVISLGFKYIYAILMEGLKGEDFSIMDSMGTGLINLLQGEEAAELPEWLPRIRGELLILLQLCCLLLLGIGTYLRNRKIAQVLWPNTPQSPAGKKVTMLIKDLKMFKKGKDHGSEGKGSEDEGKDDEDEDGEGGDDAGDEHIGKGAGKPAPTPPPDRNETGERGNEGKGCKKDEKGDMTVDELVLELKNRLVRGEITMEEYEGLREKVLE